MTTDDIVAAIRAAWPDADIQVDGGDGRYQVRVISPDFAPMTRVQRQQAVYARIGAFIRTGEIHAIGIDARPPAA